MWCGRLGVARREERNAVGSVGGSRGIVQWPICVCTGEKIYTVLGDVQVCDLVE